MMMKMILMTMVFGSKYASRTLVIVADVNLSCNCSLGCNLFE